MRGEHRPKRALATLAGATMAWSLAGLAPALAQEPERYYGPHMWGDWGAGWWMFIGPIWSILFLAAVVAVVVLIVRWISGASAGGGSRVGGDGTAASSKPLDILRERFARGEIDKEEFEERKRVLGG
jgi:putative membrane protein